MAATGFWNVAQVAKITPTIDANPLPIESMYGILPYICLKFMVNVGKYTSPMEHLGYRYFFANGKKTPNQRSRCQQGTPCYPNCLAAKWLVKLSLIASERGTRFFFHGVFFFESQNQKRTSKWGVFWVGNKFHVGNVDFVHCVGVSIYFGCSPPHKIGVDLTQVNASCNWVGKHPPSWCIFTCSKVVKTKPGVLHKFCLKSHCGQGVFLQKHMVYGIQTIYELYSCWDTRFVSLATIGLNWPKVHFFRNKTSIKNGKNSIFNPFRIVDGLPPALASLPLDGWHQLKKTAHPFVENHPT